MVVSYMQIMLGALRFCVLCGIMLLYNACTNVMQDTFKSSPNYTKKYTHVQNDKIFFEEVKEIAQFLPYKETFSSALNNLQELSDSYKAVKIPETTITFTCAFRKQYVTTLTTLLITRKYPCDNEQAGYTLQSFTKNPYKEYYGQKFANIQNEGQFLLYYTKDFNTVQTQEDLQEKIKSILMQTDSNSNAIYDLKELKHYAFMHGIVPSYEAFYMLLTQYEVKCQGALFAMPLDKILRHYDLQCKKVKYVKIK